MASCFVVQGFGKKTDFTDGRVLDLDASYAVIKEAVEAAGLECLRADEIAYSGSIDALMYRQLLEADLVVADLSTYNVNAAFELGIRYALRPRATIIVAEEQFRNPFDVGHIVIRRYRHLGEDLGAKEARRFRDELKQAIAGIMARAETDSPVYAFLPGLQPPVQPVPPSSVAPAPCPADHTLTAANSPASAPTVFDDLDRLPGPTTLRMGSAETVVAVNRPPQSTKATVDAAMQSITEGEFSWATLLLQEVLELRPNDSFVIQQLALATYKSQQPTPEAALQAAKKILGQLSPATTNDPETLGLWGAIHKRLWEIGRRPGDLDEAIEVCERGYRLRQDCYNGINLAHLLEQRALHALDLGRHDEAIADAVQSRRVRAQVLRIAEPLLAGEPEAQRRFWILATLREAAVGLGDEASAERWWGQAQALDVPGWMRETSDAQLAAVRAAQADIARLAAAPA